MDGVLLLRISRCLSYVVFLFFLAVSPHSIWVISGDATTVEVAWKPSRLTDGGILGYVLCARETLSVTCQSNKTYTSSNYSSGIITGLKPYRFYSLEVSSYNVAGEGPSTSVQHKTAEGGRF